MLVYIIYINERRDQMAGGCVAASVLAINGLESRSAICVGAKGMSGTILEYYSSGAVSSTTDTCMC